MAEISIVVPVFNHWIYTERLLESIEEAEIRKDINLHICVVDNHSDEEATKEGLKKWYESTNSHRDFRQLLPLAENKGYTGGVNVGLRFIKENWSDSDILILNNDMELFEGCIEALYDTAYSDIKIGVVGGRLMFPDGRIQHAGAFINRFGWGEHRGGGQVELEYDLIDKLDREMEYVTGAMFFIKNEVFKQLPEFDEIYSPGNFEEADYCNQVRKLGYKVIYTPRARAIHYENVTMKSMFQNPMQLTLRNAIIYHSKKDEEYSIPPSSWKSSGSIANYDAPGNERILIQGKVYGNWSFAITTRNLAKALNRNGVDVVLAPEEYSEADTLPDWEVKQMIEKPKDYNHRTVLRHSEGDHMYMMPPGTQRIAYTACESTKLPKDWAYQLNELDKVLIPSTFCMDVLRNNGISTPINILPAPVDTSIFNPNVIPYDLGNIKKGFVFFSVFAFQDRKGPSQLIKAFTNAFKEEDDVLLLIHSPSMDNAVAYYERKKIPEWLNDVTEGRKHAAIQISTRPINDDALARLYKASDVFVLPSRAEGFGLPILEAQACGVPSIVTNYSGMTDLVNESNGWLLDYYLVNIPLQMIPYYRNYIGGKWADPSVDHLTQLMKYTFEHREEVKIKGRNAHANSEIYSLESTGRMAKKLIWD